MSKLETDAELRLVTVRTKGRRRVPFGAICAVCGTDQQLSLRRDGSVTCYAHLRGAVDAAELDHLFGRAVVDHTVIRLHANAHRQITDLRRAMGMDELPTPNGEPLLLLAHILEGLASLLVLIAEWLAARVMADRRGDPPPPFPVVA
jgi:hypothetical protein